MVVVGFKSLEKMVEFRLDKGWNLVANVNPQVIVKDGDKSYFYTMTGGKIYKSNEIESISDYIEIIKNDSTYMLLNLRDEINENKVILVENNGKPKLIKTDDISSVQIVVS